MKKSAALLIVVASTEAVAQPGGAPPPPVQVGDVQTLQAGAVGTLSIQSATVNVAKPEDEDDEDEEEKKLDEDAFPLLRRGIVVGVGAGLHFGSFGNPDMQRTATAGVAYLGYLPGFRNDELYAETNAFCASYQHEAGRQRADSYAIAKTVKKYPKLAPMKKFEKADDFKKQPDQSVKDPNGKPFPTYAAAVESVRSWTPRVDADCWSRKLGVFIALPADFGADIRAGDTDAYAIKDREVRPLAMLGGILAVRPYLQVLGGIVLSRVTVADDERNRHMWSFFVGLGTPIDAIGGVFK